MSVTIQLEEEQIDAIVLKELRSSIDSFERDLQDAQDAGEDYLGVFDNDPSEDANQIVQHIEALQMIIKYYGGQTTIFQEKRMSAKVRIIYNHPVKEGVQLEVVGFVNAVTEDTTFVTRIDGYPIDILTANIISQDVLVSG